MSYRCTLRAAVLVAAFVLLAGPPAGATEPLQALGGAKPQSVALRAADGARVFGDFYRGTQGKTAPVVLLFHQAGSNAAEYVPIAPRLVAEGFHCLAIDQRAGGRKWGHDNRTAAAFGRQADFVEAYGDLEAALAWVEQAGYAGKLVVWGSSYSAALVFRLAAEHEEVDALLAFSPGEYLGRDYSVAGWAARVDVPVFVMSAPGSEVFDAKPIIESVASGQRQLEVPRVGTHGSSTLRADRNADGFEENWIPVLEFLRRHGR